MIGENDHIGFSDPQPNGDDRSGQSPARVASPALPRREATPEPDRRLGRLPRMRATFVLLAALLIAFTAPGDVAASCIQPPPIEEAIRAADVVFVGTVTGVANRDRTATVLVDEVWKGPDMAPTVRVLGGPEDENTGSSVDRTYTAGTRYLFVVQIDQGRLSDNACSSTQEMTPDLAIARPAVVRTPIAEQPSPTPAPTTGQAPGQSAAPIVLAATGLAAAGLFAALWVLRRRQGADVRER